jgi:PAS domain S-box-containing protein
MTFQSLPEAIPIGIAAVLSGTLTAFAWRHRAMPMAPAFATMMAGETAWAVGAALEPIIVELSVKRVCIDLRILGTITGILGLLAFVLRYTGHLRWLTARRFGAICALTLPLIALAWTDPWHHLYFASLSNRRIGGSVIAIRSFGPGLWAVVAYCYALATVATVLLVQAVIRFTGIHRAQATVMLFGVLLPWIIDVLDMAGIIPFIPVDLVSPSFVVTGLTFLPALFRLHLLDLPPVAWAVVIKGMDDPVVVIDGSGRIVELNPAAQRLIGRKSHEVAGIEAARAFPEWSALVDRRGRSEKHEVPFGRLGSDRALSSSFDPRISPLGDAVRPSGWVLVLRDITELKRADEERIRTLREQAARAEVEARMLREQAARADAEASNRVKDRFLATLSHELRTPLTPILATATAMLDDPATPGSFRGVLEMISRSVTLEARLIDDLLDLTRIRGGKLHLERALIDAHDLVNQVVEICRPDLRSACLEIALDLAARRHHVDADPARLQQVLWNLIKNAIKFTPPGGMITVRSRDAEGRLGRTAGTGLILEVSDTGVGIEPDLLPRIFEIFEQGGRSSATRSGGLGLGLMISRSIVEQHGGRLTAASAGRGLGATFTVELPPPGAVPVPAPPEGPVIPARAIPERPLTILLVEDNADTMNSLSRMLTERGHAVHTAASLASALRVASEVAFDVLVSDIELPDGNGLELIRTLRNRRAVPGIALSGFGSSEDMELSRSAGFAEHLIKPIVFRRLEEAIQHVAASRRAEGSVSS